MSIKIKRQQLHKNHNSTLPRTNTFQIDQSTKRLSKDDDSLSKTSTDLDSSKENEQRVIKDQLSLNKKAINKSWENMLEKNMINDEDEYCKSGIKLFVRRFLPDDYDVNKRTTQNVRDQRIQNPADACCQPNFGYCYFCKLFVVITLFLALVIYFNDSCIYFLMTNDFSKNFTSDQKVPISGSQQDEIITINSDQDEQKFIRTNKQIIIMEYCHFKYLYIILLFSGLLIYGLIFMIYTCQLIIYFYNLPWYLIESILLFGYSIILLIMTIVAYITNKHPYGTTLALLDSLIGILLSFVIFRNHSEGIVPAALITQYDPDGNLLTQILSRKHFV